MQPLSTLRAAAALAACLAASPPAMADEAQARDIFKAMSDFLVAQPAMSFGYDATLEVATSGVQKVGFASSGAYGVYAYACGGVYHQKSGNVYIQITFG